MERGEEMLVRKLTLFNEEKEKKEELDEGKIIILFFRMYF